MRKKLAPGVLAGFLAVAAPAFAQPAVTGPVDPLAFSQLKDFKALRSSSNSRYPDWNDDSAHIFPGETLTIADLEGPGIVTHIWTTSSGSLYSWPRLLRIRAYYDGSDVASVDAPLGDFFAVGHGLNPEYGRIDPYWMALAAVDEALRNLTCVGADPSRAALLDNFCWASPDDPKQLGALIRAAEGCRDAAWMQYWLSRIPDADAPAESVYKNTRTTGKGSARTTSLLIDGKWNAKCVEALTRFQRQYSLASMPFPDLAAAVRAKVQEIGAQQHQQSSP